MVPLKALLTTRYVTGPDLLTRFNNFPAVKITANAAPGFSSGQAPNLMEQVAKNNLPEGISYDWTATAYQEKQVGNQAYFIYALAIILVFLVLAAQYESWTNPAAVILVVPIALVGVILALIVRGLDNNLYTQVGLVLMIALASKNAILIVEFAKAKHEEGLSLEESALTSARLRFRPILMTAFAFILGVVPLMKASGAGAGAQNVMGTGVFWGMLVATALGVFIIPGNYTFVEGLGRRRQAVKPVPAVPSPEGAH